MTFALISRDLQGYAAGSADLVSHLLSVDEVNGECGKQGCERVHAIIEDHRWLEAVNGYVWALAVLLGPWSKRERR